MRMVRELYVPHSLLWQLTFNHICRHSLLSHVWLYDRYIDVRRLIDPCKIERLRDV
jgi:hypothetical protein